MTFQGQPYLQCIGNCRRRLHSETKHDNIVRPDWYCCRSCFKILKLTLDDLPQDVPHEDQLRHESLTKWVEFMRA